MKPSRSLHKLTARAVAFPKSSSQVIFAQLAGEDFKVFPSAVQKVNKVIARSKSRRMIRNDQEASLVAAAFFSAAAEGASEVGDREITVRYIEEAWKRLRLYDQHAPHECIERSILQRREILEKEMPMFRALVEGIKDT